MDYKQFKDPIYGYICIPSKYVKDIIDTNIFQRLRRILQTSYTPLYPSALHNRFVHSIGVYYLSQIVGERLENVFKNISLTCDVDIKHCVEIFQLACLLHDVGHVPFSHTGENFFLDKDEKNKYNGLHKKLIDSIGAESFQNDVPKEESQSAAPHELLSSIIGIKTFDKYLKTIFDKEFFARCITGYKYSNDVDEYSIYNCFISLINSKVIDIDRLDYLIRDAYFTGFETVNIDYIRLLNSLTIIENDVEKEENQIYKKYEIAYNKNAISIIENVVYAHDAERKWIQTHPIVMYDMYIIQHIMDVLNKQNGCGENSLFSLNALSPQGVVLESGNRISLLCDDDIIYLLKNNLDDELCKEFFSRDIRRHPLWKSEAEYKAFLSLKYNGQALDCLEKAIEETETYLRKHSDSWIIDNCIIQKIKDDVKKIEKQESSTEVDKKSKEKQLKSKNNILKLLNCMKEYSDECNCDCNFIILKASQFYSGFNKEEFGRIPIVFNTNDKCVTYPFKSIISTLETANEKKKEFFYLYYKRDKENKISREELCKRLYQTFM